MELLFCSAMFIAGVSVTNSEETFLRPSLAMPWEDAHGGDAQSIRVDTAGRTVGKAPVDYNPLEPFSVPRHGKTQSQIINFCAVSFALLVLVCMVFKIRAGVKARPPKELHQVAEYR